MRETLKTLGIDDFFIIDNQYSIYFLEKKYSKNIFN